ncbi:MAG: adenylate kinase [Nitrospiria bacterium]
MRLIFLGAPGVGKGTQAERLSKRSEVPHIAMGDLLREATSKKTPVGLEAKTYIERGKLVPDDVIINVIRERLKEPDAEGGYILDGFPRTIRQGEALTEILEQDRAKIDHVVYFHSDEDILMKRIAGRRSCPSCGKVYHTVYRPPSPEGLCSCGTSLIQRKDDHPETIKARLSVFKNETSPLIEYYEKQGLLLRIEAGGAVDDVSERVCRALQSCER